MKKIFFVLILSFILCFSFNFSYSLPNPKTSKDLALNSTSTTSSSDSDSGLKDVKPTMKLKKKIVKKNSSEKKDIKVLNR